jgi:hypothetical protein
MLSEAHDDNMDIEDPMFTGGTAEGMGWFGKSGVFVGV